MYDYSYIITSILKQAVIDYKDALKHNRRAKRAELEQFFLSEYGQLLSDGHGEYIIERCRKIVFKK